MGDVFDNPTNILKYASKETIENVQKCMVNPEFEKKYRQDQIVKLKSRLRQKQYERRLEEGNRNTKLTDELVMIKKHLFRHQQFVDGNGVDQKSLHAAFTFATGKNDKRSFDNRLHDYINYEYFIEAKSSGSIIYKAQDKLFEL